MPAYTLSDGVFVTIGAAAVEIGTAPIGNMAPGKQYRFTANTACYVRVTSSGGPAASAANGSHLCNAGQSLLLGALSATLNRVSVIQVSAGGVGTLSEVAPTLGA